MSAPLVLAGITLTPIGDNTYRPEPPSTLQECRLTSWVARPDILTLEAWCGGMWSTVLNPRTAYQGGIYAKVVNGAVVDMSGMTVPSTIEPYELHGMTMYRRTPVIVDGEAVT